MSKNEELNEERENGKRLATELVEHLRTMGAASTVIPVRVDDMEYQVLVAPKDMDLEQKTRLLKPIKMMPYRGVD